MLDRRRFVLAALTTPALARAVPNAVRETNTVAAPAPWFRRLLVGIEYGPTGCNPDPVYMSLASGVEIVNAVLEAEAEYLVLFCKDMEFAYYHSRAAAACPGLQGRDLLREVLDAARPHGLPVVAYCQVQYDDSSWRAHPEWRMKGADGSDLGGRLCFRSGYLEAVKSFCAEMCAYEIVGFHIDMLDFGFAPPYGCWCEVCRREFVAQHGFAMPAGPTWDAAWEAMLEFRCDSNSAFCHEVEASIKALRPELSVDFNYHGYPPFSFEAGQQAVRHARHGDFVTAEGLPFIFGGYNPSFLSLFLAAARGDRNLQVASSRSIHGYHDFTVRPAADLTWETLTYLSHGLQCTMVDKAYYEGHVDRTAYQRLATPFGLARARREWFGHEPVPRIGVWHSQRSRDWFGRDNPPRYQKSLWGAHKLLVQLHQPMAFAMDENTDLERLRELPVLMVPGAGVLREADLELLEAYVRGGGRLLLTGVTGMLDAHGEPGDGAGIGRLGGWRLDKLVLDRSDNYLRSPTGTADWLADGIAPDWPLLCGGPAAALTATSAETHAETWAARRTSNNHWVGHMSPVELLGPGVLVNRLGDGLVVTVPVSLCAAYAGEYRSPAQRMLLGNLLRWLDPDPPVRIEAPLNVESVVTRHADGRWIIHLLAWWSPPTSATEAFPTGTRVLPALMEEAHTYTARIWLRDGAGEATAVGEASEVSVDGRMVTVRTGEIHEVAAIG